MQVVVAPLFPIDAFNSLLGISEGVLFVKTKYFETSLQVLNTNQLDVDTKSLAVVLLTEGDLELTYEQENYLQGSEHAIVFSQVASEDLADKADRLGIEYASQSLTDFTGFLREDFENFGLARVKEIIELAVGSEVLAGRLPQSAQPTEEARSEPVQASESDEEDEAAEAESVRELEKFDTYMQRIRETAEAAKNLSDDARRDRAEALINEVLQFLKIDE